MENLPELLTVLHRGGVVACPTETVLGLLADAHNPRAVARVAELKGRPADLPIALLLPGPEAVAEVAAAPLSSTSSKLAARHWPGPLTILVEAAPTLSPRLVREGKVGVRVPGDSPAADLVRAFGHPLTATSANLTGEPAVRSVEQLPSSLRAGIDGEVPGVAPGGPPSTLVDATTDPIRVLRTGAIPIDASAL